MPKVTGPLKTVLSNPSQVTGAWIRSGEDRPDGDGMILDELDKATLSNGVVSFTAAPGPAVLVLRRAGGRPTNLKVIVGSTDSSLADAVKAANVANHLDSGRLVQLVGMIETTQQNAADASEAATRAENALRLDTTVGTRIFAGDTMIYGELPWRDITSLLLDGISPDNTGKVFIRSILNTVDVRFDNVTISSGTGLLTMGTLPGGFRPTGRYGSSSLSIQNSAARYQNVSFDTSGRVWWFSESLVTNSPSQTHTRPAEPLMGLVSFSADSWPTSLPGLPA